MDHDLLRRAVEEATSSTIDDAAYWNAISRLRRREPNEVWALIEPFATDDDPRLRALVPDVLRFVGGKEQPLVARTVQLLETMLAKEATPSVIESIALAFVDLHDPSATEVLRPFVTHGDAGVRGAVVHGLLPIADDAIPELIALSKDESEDVRNWATFGLGSQTDVDTPELRTALAERLDDLHDETRAEAALGLAIRKDPRAIPVVVRELENDSPWTHYAEAAVLLGLAS